MERRNCWKGAEDLKEFVIRAHKTCNYNYILADEPCPSSSNELTEGDAGEPCFDYKLIHEQLHKFALEHANQEVRIVEEEGGVAVAEYRYTLSLLSQWQKCEDGALGCPPCRRQFSKKSSFFEHLRTIHFGIPKQLRSSRPRSKGKEKPVEPESERTCDTCHLLLSTTLGLINHMAVHKPTKDFKCETCGMEFCRKGSLSIHINSHHTKIRSYPCPFCAKVMYSPYARKGHIMTHHQISRPFKCDQCDKCFKNKTSLLLHQKSHSEQRDFECTLCKRGFKTKVSLKLHSETHKPISERRKLECSFCHKTFPSAGSLKAHYSVHTGERPFECRFCGNRFRLTNHLKQHYLTHTKEKPYPCLECDSRFALKHQRDNHLKTHDKDKSRISKSSETITSTDEDDTLDEDEPTDDEDEDVDMVDVDEDGENSKLAEVTKEAAVVTNIGMRLRSKAKTILAIKTTV